MINFCAGNCGLTAKTFQIWREESELTVQNAGIRLSPLETIFEYQASEFRNFSAEKNNSV